MSKKAYSDNGVILVTLIVAW